MAPFGSLESATYRDLWDAKAVAWCGVENSPRQEALNREDPISTMSRVWMNPLSHPAGNLYWLRSDQHRLIVLRGGVRKVRDAARTSVCPVMTPAKHGMPYRRPHYDDQWQPLKNAASGEPRHRPGARYALRKHTFSSPDWRLRKSRLELSKTASSALPSRATQFNVLTPRPS